MLCAYRCMRLAHTLVSSIYRCISMRCLSEAQVENKQNKLRPLPPNEINKTSNEGIPTVLRGIKWDRSLVGVSVFLCVSVCFCVFACEVRVYEVVML